MKTEQRNDVEERSTKNCIVEKIKFFDFTVDNLKLVVNLSKHVFYKNIYAFVNRLKNDDSIRDENKLKLIISQCLRNFALIWHSTKFFEMKKEIYKNMSLQNWCSVLIKKFKERASTTLNVLQFIKYSMRNAKRHNDFRIFAQKLFRHVKAADFISVYIQLVLIWNNLNWQFRQHISQSIENTIIRAVLKQFDNNCDIWFEMIFANRLFSKRFFNSKSYQDAAKRNSIQYFNQSDRHIVFFKQKSIYMSNSQNQSSNSRSSNFEIIIKVKS